MEEAGGVMGLLGNVGASLALAFIVSLMVGLVLLAMLYLGSAVVVLERFGRVSRSPLWMAVLGVVSSIVATTVLLLNWFPELQVATWAVWWQNFTPAFLQMMVVTAVAMGPVCWRCAGSLRIASATGPWRCSAWAPASSP